MTNMSRKEKEKCMLNLIESNTTAIVSIALDAAAMRQKAFAQNIANANTPDYRALDVSFEDHLSDARAALAQGRQLSLSSLAGSRPTLETRMADEHGNSGGALDVEVARLAENTLHHQALLKALSRQFALLSYAVNEGKR
jgi:flagellar basal-body rod protein FlgB